MIRREALVWLIFVGSTLATVLLAARATAHDTAGGPLITYLDRHPGVIGVGSCLITYDGKKRLHQIDYVLVERVRACLHPYPGRHGVVIVPWEGRPHLQNFPAGVDSVFDNGTEPHR